MVGGLFVFFFLVGSLVVCSCSASSSPLFRGGSEHPMPRMRLSAAGQRTGVDGVPQIGGHYVLAFLQGGKYRLHGNKNMTHALGSNLSYS